MKLSIVTTLYKSSNSVNEFYSRISLEAKKITKDYQIIFVDDGSPDDSLQKALHLFEKDKRVIVIELSRNFGHHKAIMTGLSYAKGDFIFLIDSDLEEKPELLGQFWRELNKNKNIDVIYGYQENRKGNLFEVFSGYLFYKLINFNENINVPKNLITTRLMTRAYNKALILHKETELFLGGLFVVTGFNQKGLKVKKEARKNTTYTLRTKISLFVNAITSFTNFPLKMIFYIGIIFSLLSLSYSVVIFFNKIFWNDFALGWSSLIVSIFFIGGLILTSLGVMGLYIGKIFTETKNRPNTIIKNEYKK